MQARDTTVMADGGQAATWTDLTTLWADMAPSAGKELFAAQALRLQQPMTITMRWQPIFADPKAVAAMRVKYNTRIFSIHSVQNTDERNREIVLICDEGLNDG